MRDHITRALLSTRPTCHISDLKSFQLSIFWKGVTFNITLEYLDKVDIGVKEVMVHFENRRLVL
jgi:hypothetical protein